MVSGNLIKQYLEKIENLEQQKSDIAGDIREVYSEAKSEKQMRMI